MEPCDLKVKICCGYLDEEIEDIILNSKDLLTADSVY